LALVRRILCTLPNHGSILDVTIHRRELARA